jgi:hypothetical protein
MSTSTTSPTEERALTLLGQGLAPSMVASAIGVSESRISQLVSDPEFASRIAELRFSSLVKHNETDSKYDAIEAKLQGKLEGMVDWMVKPFEVLKAIQVINGAKRRGISAPEQIVGQQTVVQLSMPTMIINQYSTKQEIQVNVNNQVVKAGQTELVTIQSSQMDKLLGARNAAGPTILHSSSD